METLKHIDIIKEVADYFRMPVSEVISPHRYKEGIKAKHIAMYACRVLTGSSLWVIGKAFGKDHSTVIHACKSVSSQASIYANYQEQLDEIMCRIKKIPMMHRVRNDYDTDKT